MSLNNYLRETWHVSTRPAVLELDDEVRWIGLEIVGRTRGGLLDKIGSVEFRATYTLNGHSDVQHENSRFFCEGRAWLYVDAIR